jgi:hypothetical protein
MLGKVINGVTPLIFGWFGTGLHTVLLFQSFATNLAENFAPLIGVEISVEPAQGDTDHVAMADLRTRFFLGNLKPELVYSFRVLWPESGRVLAEDIEL